MCGIIAYLGHRQALPILLSGLKRLEYRGYDSAGVAVFQGSGADKPTLTVVKKVGKVSNLVSASTTLGADTGLGIGHTRWATHGVPSDANSHPHTSKNYEVSLVHNGIIENYHTLRETILAEGYVLTSETDTEVLAHFIHSVWSKHPGYTLAQAVSLALTQVEGAFGIAVVSSRFPDLMVGSRKGSPLLMGVGDGEHFLASDASAVIEYTNRVVYLNDGDVVEITREGYNITTLDQVAISREVHHLELSLSEIEKSGFKHFMLKEIMDQPRTLENCMRGRVDPVAGTLRLGGLEGVMDRLAAARRIIICACGTSWHAGQVGEYLLETLARVPVEVEYASEFRYRDPILFPDDVVMVISQSGETADTLAAVRLARERGCLAIGVCNVVGSSIARETDAGVYLHAGPEIGVASTKAFTGQIVVLAMIALELAKHRGSMTAEAVAAKVRSLATVPDLVARVLSTSDSIRQMCNLFKYASNFLYLGRGFNFPVALEGALKLKEISYIHAEGYPAAEMKHGPIALIDKFMPVVVIAPSCDATYSKVKANIEEVLARSGSVIVVTEEHNHDFDGRVDQIIYVPAIEECFTPLVAVIPLQLMSYYIADLRKCNVDQPRNLAKSVTVE